MAKRFILFFLSGLFQLTAFAQEQREITVSGSVQDAWNGQVSKAFLKSKTLVVALNFYDLLGQQSNYERWVNANGRSDQQKELKLNNIQI